MPESDCMAQFMGDDIARHIGQRERIVLISADGNEPSSIAEERAGKRNKIPI